MGALIQDLRYSLRTLLRAPGFVAAGVLTLALGIGANTAIFSVVYAVLLRPLPYKDPGRLVAVYERTADADSEAIAPADFIEYQKQSRVFERMAGVRGWSFNLTGEERPQRVSGASVTADFFPVLGVAPRLGRTFDSGDHDAGGERAVVLSYALWQTRFGGSASVLGTKLMLNDEPSAVAGVMPPGFQYPGDAQLWLLSRHKVPEHPLRPNIDQSTMRGTHYFQTIARLKPGVTLAQARADADTITRRLAQQYKDEEAVGANLVALQDDLVGDTKPALFILLAAVGLVLLIACANVANLLLARGAARQKEMAIRGALGASRLRVVRQLLTESFLLSVCGGALGIILASWGIGPLVALIPSDVRAFANLRVSPEVLAFTLFLSVFTAIIFGLAPALQAAKHDLNETLKEGGRSLSGGLGHHRLRNSLVVAEIALAFVLLVGAGLLMRSFLRVQAVEHGFDPENVLTLQLSLAQAGYPDAQKKSEFVKQILERIGALPGVRSTAVVSRLPLSPGNSSRSITIQGRTPPPGGEDVSPDYQVVSPDYFRTLRVQLMRGRDFTERDDAKAVPVAIISDSMARHFWPGQDPVGKLFKVGDEKDWRQVVGVVADLRQHGLDQPPRQTLYLPYPQDPWPFMSLVVRTRSSPLSLASSVEHEVRVVDRGEPVYNTETMEQVVSESMSSRRYNLILLGLFAALALVLASLGIYGVVAYAVAQRTHEIGIRMTLGARRADVLGMVVKQGMILALAGIGLGLIGALSLTRVLSSLLYGVRSTDPGTFAAVPIVLVGVSLLASYLPALRATKVDPMMAVRHE